MPAAAAVLLMMLAPAGGHARISSDAAQIALLAITGGGALAWLAAIWGYRRTFALGPNEAIEPDEGRFVVTQVKVVSGSRADLADGLTRALASPGWGMVPLLVKREGDDLLVAVPSASPRLRSVPTFSSCTVELRAAGSRGTEVTFRTEFTAVRRRAALAARILLVAGLAMLVALPVCLQLTVVPSDFAAVRAQALQAVHVVHLLWPPWLVYAIYRRGRRATMLFLDAAANNASVLAEAFAAKRAKDEAEE